MKTIGMFSPSNLNRQLQIQAEVGSKTPASSGEDEERANQRHNKSDHSAAGVTSSHRPYGSSETASTEHNPALPVALLHRLLR
jgi:hypothetical protein